MWCAAASRGTNTRARMAARPLARPLLLARFLPSHSAIPTSAASSAEPRLGRLGKTEPAPNVRGRGGERRVIDGGRACIRGLRAAVNRVSSALAYATLLGLEVETDDSMSGASRATKKRRGASTERDAAPPYAFLAVDAAARGLRVTDVIAGERMAPGAASKPAVVAAQVIQVASLEASRGRDSHASHVLAHCTTLPLL